MRHHELRDDDGRLIAVLDVIEGKAESTRGMIELAADVDGSSFRIRIFPRKAQREIAAVAA